MSNVSAEADLQIEGMTCDHCVARVQKALLALPGVSAAQVSIGHATVRHEGVSADAMARAVADVGYTVVGAASAEEKPTAPVAEDRRTSVPVFGMHCASCVSAVERELTAIPGVATAYVNLVAQQATVSHGATVSEAQLRAAVVAAGYRSPVAGVGESRLDLQDRARTDELRDLQRRLGVSIPLTAVVMALAMGPMLVPSIHLDARWSIPLQAALTLPVWLYGGSRFLMGMFQSVRRRSADMNTLIGLGTSVSYLWSVAAWLWPMPGEHGHAPVYFESAAAIVVLILVGNSLETMARGRASRAVRQLLDLAPETASLVKDGQERELPVRDLVPGDRVRVRPGERVPTDGIVVEGATHLDVSAMTGESAPRAVGVGDEIFGGSLDLDGQVDVEVLRPGATSMMGRIVQKVEAAQGSRAPVQRLADRVAAVFVPVVLLIAVVTLLFWLWYSTPVEAITRAVAVLIIACPCALGIATPTSILVATGRAASLGILFRDAASLESAGGLVTIALDKTGTLTEGRPVVEKVVPVSQFSESDVLLWAAAAESGSKHPIAKAFADAAPTPLPPATGFISTVGKGISAYVNGRMVRVGSRRGLAEQGLEVPPLAGEEGGATVVWVAADAEVVGAIFVVDRIRETSKRAVQRLQELGAQVVMLTGDRRSAGEAVAAQVGITEVIAEVLPDQKGETISGLRARGPVGMVGDGINDAPALASADVGFAMQSGSDVAMEAAPVVLLRNDLRSVVDAVELSRLTLRNIRQNLVFAFLYNGLGIPLAAGVFSAWGVSFSPMFAAGAMALSSVCVVGNSLRLQRGGLG